jgi:hypothetical protein
MDGGEPELPLPAPAADAAASPLASRRPRARLGAAMLGAAATALALFLLWRVLHRYSLAEIGAAVAALPAASVGAAVLCAAASYLTLSLFDYLGVRYTGRKLAWPSVALASFTALSIGHSIGLAALSSGALRYRFYRAWGLSRGDVARVILFCAATSTVGLLTVNGAALVAAPRLLAEAADLAPPLLRALGLLCLAVVPAYLALALWVKPQLLVRGWWLKAPRPRLAMAQVILGPLNFLLVSATLHQLLSASTDVSFLAVAGIYAVANLISILAHVPGGWGVLETAVVLALPDTDPIGALVVFRVVYWLGPFLLGLVTLAAAEGWRHRVRSTVREGSPATPSSG